MVLSFLFLISLLSWCPTSADLVSGAVAVPLSRHAAGNISDSMLEPCARVSQLLSSNADSLGQQLDVEIPAELAYECAMSAPLNTTEALQLLEIVQAVLEWHSTFTYLKDPPPGYLLSPTDILADLDSLRHEVASGTFTSEHAFQQRLTDIFSSAHDGHLYMNLDTMRVFSYVRPIGNIVSLSLDGKEWPRLYDYGQIRYRQKVNSSHLPSPIVTINNMDAESWVLSEALNTTSYQHDPDAMYNAFLKSPVLDGNFEVCTHYPGPDTTFVFEDGTTKTHGNKAVLLQDFTGVVDGESFRNKFVLGDPLSPAAEHAPVRVQVNSNMSEAGFPDQTLDSYPKAIYATDDYSMSGYFMNETGFEDVAVLNLRSFFAYDSQQYQSALSGFLTACLVNNKQHLIIDIQGNPGGDIGLGYEAFRQLFPDIEPYAAANHRSHDQFDILGAFFTQKAYEVLRQSGNAQDYIDAGGYSFFDARAFDNATGQRFQSWDEFNGPVQTHGDNFTNLVRLDIDNVNYDTFLSGIIFSEPPMRPFAAENITILSDGVCSSTCDIFMHLMKWQGHVKTIVGGGRPVAGAMQSVGGSKARRKLSISYLNGKVKKFYSTAPQELQTQANRTKLRTVLELGDYLAHRTRDWYGNSSSSFSVNIANAVAERDESFTPLQFVFEAADCKLWWRPEHYFDITSLWALAASTAFGLNGTEPWHACVEGSTSHPSSVSGGGKVVFDSPRPRDNDTVDSGSDGGANVTDRGGSSPPGQNSGPPKARSFYLTEYLLALAGFIAITSLL